MPKIIATAEVINNSNSYTSNLQVNQHSLIVDEPLEKGGEDLGPAPGDYLCAALASCKAITLRMYVQRKQWNVDEIKVSVHLVPAAQMPSGNNTFYCNINFKGELNDEQQKRLLVIANSCPLHRLLSKPSDVVTEI
ncbi:MAG: OsmC family protein, partial [Ginsengibacter sp.]